MTLLRGLAALASVFVLLTAPACADQRAGAVYDAGADAGAAIDAALAEAAARDTPALIVFGANWCHDSRGFADRILTDETLAPFMAAHYAVAFVDVGVRHRNLDQAARFGIEAIYGTPTLVVVDGAGALLNAGTVHDWRAVYDADAADISAYFARLAGTAPPLAVDAVADIDAAADAWPALAAALDGLDAVPETDRDHARAYYRGLARSLVRNAMGRVGDAQDAAVAARDDVEALGLAVETDLTEAVIARLEVRNVDLEARRQADRADTEVADAG